MELDWAFTLHQTVGIFIGFAVVYVITKVINKARRTDEE